MKRFFIRFLLFCSFLVILGLGAGLLLYIYIVPSLPSITKVHDYRLPQVSTVYARDGSVMGLFYEEKRYLVNLDRIPKHVIDSFLAAEDARFFEHGGLDFKGIFRSAVLNLLEGSANRGGSTITQQVVKRVLLSSDKKYERKIKEAIISYQLERYLSKEEILYLYLNQVFFGNNAHGIEAASRTYFAKHVEDLSIAEGAILAGLLQAPSRYNPFRNPDAARARQLYVLEQMYLKGFIDKASYDAAVAEKLVFDSMPEPTWTLGAWYLEEVRRQVMAFLKKENVDALNLPIDIYGKDALYQGGLHIYTGMDPINQLAAEEAVRYGLHEASKRRGWRGPIKHISEAEYGNFLENNFFSPELLNNAGWVKALVTRVDKNQASVELGKGYKGFITLENAEWARVLNLSEEGRTRVQDMQKILFPGDIVWVSAVGAYGNSNPVSVPATSAKGKKAVKEYEAPKIKVTSPIPLALEQFPNIDGALASIDTKSGDLVALVGGYAFSPTSQFNRATQANRQTGSAFKSVVYSAALDAGFTVASLVLDEPFVLPAAAGRAEWRPKNIDKNFLGPIPMLTALAKSRNACTVRLAYQIGVPAMVERAKDLGVRGDIPPFLAISLGSYEMTPLNLAEMYTAFSNGGKHVVPRLITRIENSWGEELVSFAPNIRQAISPQNAFLMSYMLEEVVNAGTATRVRSLGRPVAGKTGTSNEERDGWFVGATPYITSSVYVGYDDHRPMGRSEVGGRSALPIFIKYHESIDSIYPPDNFTVPPGIVFANIDMETGLLANQASTKVRYLPFINGTVPSFYPDAPTLWEESEGDIGVELLKQF